MLVSVIIVLFILAAGVSYYMFYIRPKFDPVFRAELFEKQELLREAVLEYRKALEKNRGDYRSHYRLGNLYLRLDDLDQAFFHFEKLRQMDKFDSEVDRRDVLKKLANLYFLREEIDKAFQTYMDVLYSSPTDQDALYHVSFIALGQEEFDFAQKYFDRLVKVSKNDFEVYFGAGICSFQNQKITDALNYFKMAIAVKRDSDAANLAMAFALKKKKDLKPAMPFAAAVASASTDPAVEFISKRLLAFLNVESRQHDEAIKIFQEILDLARRSNMNEETLLTLYDLGYACVRGEKTGQAYDYWNELYQADRNYKKIQRLVTLLRKEMDRDPRKPGDEFEESVTDTIDDWVEEAFPPNFIWDICGLKSDKKFDLRNILVTTRISVGKESDGEPVKTRGDYTERLDQFCGLDNENFRIAANRVVSKMGYKVDQILQTYREADGVDFLAYSLATKDRTLVWVRRWTKNMVGEITLRNFAQAINDAKAKQGLLITTTDLTEAAKGNLDRLSKVTVIYPDQLSEFLRGII